VSSVIEGKELLEDPECMLYETLIVTDHGEIARFYMENGYPVMGCLHEKNKEEQFDMKYVISDCDEVEESYFDMVFCRTYGIPLVILETKRCIVREMSEDDLEELYRLYEDKNVTRYMEDLFVDKEEELAYIKNYVERIYSYYGYGIWNVIKKDTMELIGRAGVEYKSESDGLELGYLIGTDYQKCGYATEVCLEIIHYVKSELAAEKIVAIMDEENQASIALCRKLGFREVLENKLKDDHYLKFEINLKETKNDLTIESKYI